MKIVHLNYHHHAEFSCPSQVIEKHKLSSGFVNFIKHLVKFVSVKHLDYEGKKNIEGVDYNFFKSRNCFGYIPFATHKFIKSEQPDVVLVEGFVFPLQVMALRFLLAKECKIIAQHHGEKPFTGVKGWLQRMGNRCIDAFIFTSLGNADRWIDKKMFSRNKCYEVLSASTDIVCRGKEESKMITGFTGAPNFLWVGRLNANKDPLTVIAAFEKYIIKNPLAKLYMIYQTEELLPEIKARMENNSSLKNAIIPAGKKDHGELADWYSAADIYISGSHSEGSGYALVEAMACGCIPIVTDIPSFNKITDNGNYGLLYKAGDPVDLYKKLLQLDDLSTEVLSAAIKNYSNGHLSYQSISNQLYQLCRHLTGK